MTLRPQNFTSRPSGNVINSQLATNSSSNSKSKRRSHHLQPHIINSIHITDLARLQSVHQRFVEDLARMAPRSKAVAASSVASHKSPHQHHPAVVPTNPSNRPPSSSQQETYLSAPIPQRVLQFPNIKAPTTSVEDRSPPKRRRQAPPPLSLQSGTRLSDPHIQSSQSSNNIQTPVGRRNPLPRPPVSPITPPNPSRLQNTKRSNILSHLPGSLEKVARDIEHTRLSKAPKLTKHTFTITTKEDGRAKGKQISGARPSGEKVIPIDPEESQRLVARILLAAKAIAAQGQRQGNGHEKSGEGLQKRKRKAT
jgi:hypothetical protein